MGTLKRVIALSVRPHEPSPMPKGEPIAHHPQTCGDSVPTAHSSATLNVQVLRNWHRVIREGYLGPTYYSGKSFAVLRIALDLRLVRAEDE